MSRIAVFLSLLGVLVFVRPVDAEPEERESAVEEIMPGVFIRDDSGVTIDLGDRRCDPPCGEGESCESVCAETACAPREGPGARCSTCTWECQ